MTTLVEAQLRSSPGGKLPSRAELAQYHIADELRLVGGLIERAIYTADDRRKTADLARRLVEGVRRGDDGHGGIDAFMKEYGFTSEEGVILMCLAEALLRIPDAETADALIADKVADGAWADHLGRSDSLFVNASTWGLMLTGRIVALSERRDGLGLGSLVNRLVKRSGEPVIRNALRQAMRIMGDQFVLGRTVQEALKRAARLQDKGYRFSFDMLGEAAYTERDAQRYFDRYVAALEAVGRFNGPLFETHSDAIFARPSISVKLSAIHPRYEPGKEAQLSAELLPRLVELASAAREQGLGLTIDAEEQDRLDLSLGLFGELFMRPELVGWNGLGLAVQAYGKRAIPVLRWLRQLALEGQRRIAVRLVKGAYWDSEIKWAQERGLADYPVFTRKLHTDVSYLACARLLLSDPNAFYPQFATHNAHTLATMVVSGRDVDYELQRLHGMGEALYDQVIADAGIVRSCRIYAPVGGHEDLLAYLVRRLLENGANTSFVNRLADDELPISEIIADPVRRAEDERQSSEGIAALPLPRPPAIFADRRRNSLGLALSEPHVRDATLADIGSALRDGFSAAPIIDGQSHHRTETATFAICPHDRRQRMGLVTSANGSDIEAALSAAAKVAKDWSNGGGEARAVVLEKVADLYERDRARLMAVIVREAGKTLDNALGDVREAVDFLRYYANEARRLFAGPEQLAGVTGETNMLMLQGRGPFLCISPWNFPLAIFTGQIAGALAAGNPVLAKPAEQTPLTAFAAVQLFHEAGVPSEVLQLLPGDGEVGARLVADTRIRGVAFTGSNETAWLIQRALADRRGEIVPFIAETGGINAMIVDSSALLEQVTRDVMTSAFDSAGQRCSAARVLFVQTDIADRLIDMLAGAAELLRIGDPIDYGTDVGPVIDGAAQDMLDAHKARMYRSAKLIKDCLLPDDCRNGTYVTPALFEIEAMADLDREVFGPILHVVRYAHSHIDKVCAAINASGFGLTLGIHTRIEHVAEAIAARVSVGNVYINRNQIGAVVGVQPFGGRGLSGTGPKAGGPHYVAQFATEQVITTDVTATGGNLQLLSLSEQSPSPANSPE